MAFSEVNRLVSERIPLDKVISNYVKLEPTSKGFKGLCPFHKEKTPSFHVNTVENFFYCFGCQASGNAITFLIQKEGLTFGEALKKLAEDFKVPELINEVPEINGELEAERAEVFDVNRSAAKLFIRNLVSDEVSKKYLSDRNVKDEMVKRFAIGSAGSSEKFISDMSAAGASINALMRAGLIRLDHNSRPVSFFYNRIMIPIIYNKNVIGFGGRLLSGDGPKYINSPDTVVFNKKEHLFGIDFVREGLKDFPFVVLCEGYFDVIAMHSSGFRTAVAALGTAVSDSHLRTLAKFRKPVVVFLDGDEAGRKAARRITTLQIPDDIDLRVAFIKDEGDDPDSLLRKEGGAEKVRALIEKARPLFQEMIDEQLEKYNGTENLEEKLKIEGDIRSILKNIPHRKVRTYAVYIQKRSGNMINTGTVRHNNIEKAAQKAELGVHVKTEDADTELDSKLRDLAVMACMYNEFIPSLESLSDAFYDSRFALVFDDIMKRYNEQEDLGDIIEKLDDTGAVSEKYRDKSFDLIDRDFRRNHAYLMIEKNDRLRRVLEIENNDEARKRIAALLQDTAALRKIYNDNAI